MSGTARSSGSATGTFEVEIVPVGTELGGAAGRFELRKTFRGDLVGTGTGLMLSAGDPATGAAGYVALEVVTGTLAGRTGSLALQQLGRMTPGGIELRYSVAPGSGTGELVGVDGELTLEIVGDEHRFRLDWTLPGV